LAVLRQSKRMYWCCLCSEICLFH